MTYAAGTSPSERPASSPASDRDGHGRREGEAPCGAPSDGPSAAVNDPAGGDDADSAVAAWPTTQPAAAGSDHHEKLPAGVRVNQP